MSYPTFSLQPLESRRLLSTSAVHVHEECPEVAEARAELAEIVMSLRHERHVGRAEIAVIRAEIGEEVRKLFEGEQAAEIHEALAPLRAALKSAVRSQTEQRREILAELHEIRARWQPIIEADIKAVLEAKAAGDQEALAEATKKVEADRGAMKAELLPVKQELEAFMTESRAAISAARQAIEDKLAEFSPTLADMLEELRTKAKALEQKLIAGHEAAVAAQQKLADAIAQCREEHAEETAIA